MDTVLITGSGGLVGSEAVRFFAQKGFRVIGIDNNMREVFFGEDASVQWNVNHLKEKLPNYVHYTDDIREKPAMERIFLKYSDDIKLVIHTAAQPSHDWAAKDPLMDFSVNAQGTLVLLELTRNHCSDAVFIFTSTNKVYGDTPNTLLFTEEETRYEIDDSHPYLTYGIDENMSIDQSKHSLFGASKLAADILVQEYGKYFNMKTACFRCGCLSGPAHSGTKLHGFLSYLMKCAISGKEYTVLGYKGKQVRDNLHSSDLVSMFWHFYQNPRLGVVYNAGGGRQNSCSVLEAIKLCENITGKKVNWSYDTSNRIGDHLWWISDTRKFKSHYPQWNAQYSVERILLEIYETLSKRE